MSDFNDADTIGTRGGHCCSRFQLERFVAGELEDGTSRDVSIHLETCALCQELLATMEKEKVAFRKKIPFDDFYAGLAQRLEKNAVQELATYAAQGAEARVAGGAESLFAGGAEAFVGVGVEAPVGGGVEAAVAGGPEKQPEVRRGTEPEGALSAFEVFFSRVFDFFRALSMPALAGVAVAALALVVVVPRLGDELPGLEDGPAGVGNGGGRIKAGRIAPGPLEVEVLRQGEVRRLESGSVFWEGDRLQFKINPGSWGYVQVFSLDDQGHLSPFYQGEGGRSLSVISGREQHLPDSIRLDDFVGRERVFAVFTESPVAFEVVEGAVEELVQAESVPLDLSRIEVLPIDDAAQVSFLMVKE